MSEEDPSIIFLTELALKAIQDGDDTSYYLNSLKEMFEESKDEKVQLQLEKCKTRWKEVFGKEWQ